MIRSGCARVLINCKLPVVIYLFRCVMYSPVYLYFLSVNCVGITQCVSYVCTIRYIIEINHPKPITLM